MLPELALTSTIVGWVPDLSHRAMREVWNPGQPDCPVISFVKFTMTGSKLGSFPIIIPGPFPQTTPQGVGIGKEPGNEELLTLVREEIANQNVANPGWGQWGSNPFSQACNQFTVRSSHKLHSNIPKDYANTGEVTKEVPRGDFSCEAYTNSSPHPAGKIKLPTAAWRLGRWLRPRHSPQSPRMWYSPQSPWTSVTEEAWSVNEVKVTRAYRKIKLTSTTTV